MDRKLAKPKYLELRDLKKVVCTTQRGGSTSMIEAMRPAYPDSAAELITAAEALARRCEGWPVLLWVRDPFEKFASAYAIFGKGRIPSGRGIVPQSRRNVHEFVNLVTKVDDAHWAPQTRTHTFAGVFLPTRVYPFYNLAETWAEEMPGRPIALLNSTKRKSWDDLKEELSADEIQRLEDHYHDDIALLRWCNEYGVHEVAA
jgi:hypothetical protein